MSLTEKKIGVERAQLEGGGLALIAFNTPALPEQSFPDVTPAIVFVTNEFRVCNDNLDTESHPPLIESTLNERGREVLTFFLGRALEPTDLKVKVWKLSDLVGAERDFFVQRLERGTLGGVDHGMVEGRMLLRTDSGQSFMFPTGMAYILVDLPSSA